MNSVFFPLRSNAGWFEKENTRDALERRIKRSLVLYDHVVFQAGRHLFVAWANGGMDFDMGPQALGDDIHDIAFFDPGTGYRFEIQDPKTGKKIAFLDGPAEEAYEVDFRPLLKDADLLDADFLSFKVFDVTQEAKNELKARAHSDITRDEIIDVLPGNQFQKSRVAEAAHFDSLLAGSLSTSFVCDHRVGKFIAEKSRLVATPFWGRDFKPEVAERMASLMPLPDFGDLEWDAVVDIRESDPGRDFRAHLDQMMQEIVHELAAIETEKDLDQIVSKHIVGDLLSQVQANRPKMGTFLLGAVANFLPHSGLVSTAAESVKFLEDKRSWLNLLRSNDSV